MDIGIGELSRDEVTQIIADCGGSPFTRGGAGGLWFGLRPNREEDTAAVCRAFDAGEPLLFKSDRVVLPLMAKRANGGRYPRYSWQLTGSCVNSGMNNALITRIGVERCLEPAPEVFATPFTLPAYAYSRWLAYGDDTEGEGSSGDAIARAIKILGSCQSDKSGVPLPKPNLYENAYTYTKQIELQFSAWHNISAEVRSACAPHTAEYVQVTTADQAESEIRKGRPLTWAGNWGSAMQMSYRGSGANRHLFGPYADHWEHQQSVHGVWHNPEFGRLWLVLNNWYMLKGGVAVPVHGAPASDEPPGSYWVDDSAMNHQLNYRFGAVRAIGQFKGFDQGTLDHFAV